MILVTGGCGYIGSHTVVELLGHGEGIVIVDNCCNSNPAVLERIETITGSSSSPIFLEGNILNMQFLEKIFRDYEISSVIHFAGLKSVADSINDPMSYYENNFIGTVNLIKAMEKGGVFKLVFSSSATVYGEPNTLPIPESHPIGLFVNPYGATKYFIECFLSDMTKQDARWSFIALRYFNPIGAHKSGLIGECPVGIPNNLLPFITQVATGALEKLQIFGNDYNTLDGTGVRDYIHVVDLSKGHVRALNFLEHFSGYKVFNLGTGKGYSVLQVIKSVEQCIGRPINYEVTSRREGDVAACFADPSLAKEELGWVAEESLKEMVADALNWQRKNPSGYLHMPKDDTQ